MIMLQSDVSRALSALELDENFRNLSDPNFVIGEEDTSEDSYTPDMLAPGNVFTYIITEKTIINPPSRQKVGTYGFLMIWQDDRGGHEYEFSKEVYWETNSKIVPSRRPSSMSIFRYNVVEEDVILIEMIYTDPKVMSWDNITLDEEVILDNNNIDEAGNEGYTTENGVYVIIDEVLSLHGAAMSEAANIETIWTTPNSTTLDELFVFNNLSIVEFDL